MSFQNLIERVKREISAFYCLSGVSEHKAALPDASNRLQMAAYERKTLLIVRFFMEANFNNSSRA